MFAASSAAAAAAMHAAIAMDLNKEAVKIKEESDCASAPACISFVFIQKHDPTPTSSTYHSLKFQHTPPGVSTLSPRGLSLCAFLPALY